MMSGRGNKKVSRLDTNTKWNVGIYSRRSFDDLEDTESNTITNQKNMITDYVNSLPNMTIVDYYSDDGYSGTTLDRPRFKEMMNDVISGRINAIVSKDLSRLGRNHLELGKYLEQTFPIYNIRIIAINDDIDSFLKPETFNNFIVPLKNIINENYSKDISKKVSSSYLTMAKQGKFISGTTPYGYKLDKNDKHHLVVDEEEQEICKLVFNMALNGNGIVKICKYLNNNHILCRKEIVRRRKHKLSLDPYFGDIKYLWSTSSIRRMLSNETYIGNLVQLKTYKRSYKERREIPKPEHEWIKCENTHEAIISKEEFNKIQELVKKRTPNRSNSDKEYSIYNGILKCADCGKAMLKQEDKRKEKIYSNYYCSSYLYTNSSCSQHKIKTKELDSIVLETIQLQIKLVIEIDRSIKKLFFKSNKYLRENDYKNNVRIAEIKIDSYKEKKRNNYKNWKLQLIDKKEYEKNLNEYDLEIEKLTEDINLYTSSYQETISRLRKDEYWISHYKRNRKIKKLTRDVLMELIKNIYVNDDGSIKIIFKYEDEYKELLHYLSQERSTKECQTGKLVSI